MLATVGMVLGKTLVSVVVVVMVWGLIEVVRVWNEIEQASRAVQRRMVRATND